MWRESRENNELEFPDPKPPTLAGIPEWVEGLLDVLHVTAPWGEYDSVTVLWNTHPVPVESHSVQVVNPQR
jgi:hypothetical protein